MSKLTNVMAMVAGVVMLGACASAPNTYSNADPAADFSSYRTYGFIEPLATDTEKYESLVSNFLKVAFAQQMDRRGLSFDEENPDLRVNFFINTKDRIRSRTVPAMGGYYGYRSPFYDPWYGYGGMETQVDQYTEGTLNIDIVDARTDKLVWEGAVTGRVTDEAVRHLEKSIDGAVAAIMDNFPITPGSKK